MKLLEKLEQVRLKLGKSSVVGLSDDDLKHFLQFDNNLAKAIEVGLVEISRLEKEYPEIMAKPDTEQIAFLQKEFINFYDPTTVNPYVAISAFGPWIFTSKARIIYDAGGYGMLGLGHNPENLGKTLSKPEVMANIMTAQFAQFRFTEALRQELGQNRKDKVYSKFVCLNSGSESMTLAARLADINTLEQIRVGKNSQGKKFLASKFISLKGSFHGRTEKPSQMSDSCLKTYRERLFSFQNLDNLITVPINDVGALESAFKQADKDQVFIEAVLLEPVMGEGNPGAAISLPFYSKARELTLASGSLLIIDSIQAGLRAHGVLSICDYPGFGAITPPDIESFSKALNAGQYPLSVLALSERSALLYKTGVYGNTMTTNPRALDIATEVLSSLDSNLRQNIVEKGKLILAKFKELEKSFPKLVLGSQGTGLLFSLELAKDLKVVGSDGIETYLRKEGLGVIHGGENSVRFTPHFAINDEEINLMVRTLARVLHAKEANKETAKAS